jgi:hypothetical protein
MYRQTSLNQVLKVLKSLKFELKARIDTHKLRVLTSFPV